VPVDGTVGIEAPDAIFETADHRRVHWSVRLAGIDPPDRPGALLGVVRPHGHAVGHARGAVEGMFLDIHAAVDGQAIGAGAVEFDPLAVAEDFVVDAPVADLEVEAVRALLRRGMRAGGFGICQGRRGQADNGSKRWESELHATSFRATCQS